MIALQWENKPKEFTDDAIKKLRENFKVFLQYFQKHNLRKKLMIGLAAISVAVVVYFAINLVVTTQKIHKLKNELTLLWNYDITALQNNEFTKNLFSFNTDTIVTVMRKGNELDKEIDRYQQKMKDLVVPYENFLQYVYLPPLNVRKNIYSQQINTEMIGVSFLENNPYDDIKLLQKWKEFFRNAGDNVEMNQIIDSTIGDIQEDDKGFFTIPLTLSFVSESKRSFLLLVDKLSMTSNRKNIHAINEFLAYLRDQIKVDQEETIKELKEQYIKGGSGQEAVFSWKDNITDDLVIGYHIYEWIMNGKENRLIENSTVDTVVKNLMYCKGINDEKCYYKFREKYKDIPTFGYLIGIGSEENAAENIKKFILALPPIFSIQSFSFDRIKATSAASRDNWKYQGKIVIDIYGRGIKAEEVTEITTILGKKCFGADFGEGMSSQYILRLITNEITKLSEFEKESKEKTWGLWELKWIVEKIDKEYALMKNYEKVVKSFELYRMTRDVGLCETN